MSNSWPIHWDKLQPRAYQLDSAQQILQKGSTLLVMPTALGKTFVAVLVMGGLLQKNPKGRILFLAPTKPLAVQQASRIIELLSLDPANGGVQVLTGETLAENRRGPWRDAQVIVATPQTCVWDIKAKRGSLEGFSLMVVDECHRAVGDYAYSILGRLAQQDPNLLVLGLTASPSSEAAKIEEIRFNLGAKNVIIKSEDDPQVKEFVQEVEVDWEYVHLPPLFALVKERLEVLLAQSVSPLVNRGVVTLKYKGQGVNNRMLLEARGVLLAAINRGDKTAYSALSQQARAMNLVHAIDLLESQGLNSLNEFLLGLKERTASSKAVKSLWEDTEVQSVIRQVKSALDKGVEHPKFARTASIVSEAVLAGKKVIVFAHYRNSVTKIVTLLNSLPNVKALQLVGRSNAGMTQKQQAKAIEDFRDGTYNVLVASSVAEEGLDIPSVDLVVFFEPVPSEVRSIQRRGRAGRVKAGQTKVLLAKGTKDEALFWISRRKEELMHSTLKDLSEKSESNYVERKSEAPKQPSTESQRKLEDY